MGERENFCRVCEGDWTFSWRVECVEEIDEEGDETQMGATATGTRDIEAESCCKQSPAHIWEGKQE